MRRCPKCQRIFRDESLKFCRIDGEKLVATSDTLNFDEAPTLPLYLKKVSGGADQLFDSPSSHHSAD